MKIEIFTGINFCAVGRKLDEKVSLVDPSPLVTESLFRCSCQLLFHKSTWKAISSSRFAIALISLWNYYNFLLFLFSFFSETTFTKLLPSHNAKAFYNIFSRGNRFSSASQSQLSFNSLVSLDFSGFIQLAFQGSSQNIIFLSTEDCCW